MRTYADCIPCLFRQALNTVRVASSDPDVQQQVMTKLLARAAAGLDHTTPASLSKPAYEIVSEVTGISDPYAEIKAATNVQALQLLPQLQQLIGAADDPLELALHIAAAGNVIDFGIGHIKQQNIETEVMQLIRQPFRRNACQQFRRALTAGCHIVYLGDNSGEIVFDRILIEQLLSLGCNVTFVVKAAPIINDATMIDAETAGITAIVPVITTGSDDIGVNWQRCSESFRTTFAAADLVLSKGQGNYETCSGHGRNTYFLLKAKCDCVAAELGVNLGDLVFTL